MRALENKLPLRELWLKREEQNPTGSFKARGFSVAVSLLNERGYKKLAVPSNGNAASSLAAYAAYAGMEAFVFLPKDTPTMIVQECMLYGAQTYLVDGFIHDASAIITDGMEEQGWFHVGTLREPGRVEGKKTMGLEVAEQLNWDMPDVIVYPTGGGSGIIGMWKAFKELKELGFIHGELPRLISVQEAGCQPLVDGMNKDIESAEEEEGMHKVTAVTASPTGMRVPNPPDEGLILSILLETGGTAVAVSREDISTAQHVLGSQGISSSPEGAATWAALSQLLERGFLERTDRVVLFNTSHAMKYLPGRIDRKIPVVKDYRDWLLQNASHRG
jgi:threonine synthase